ncbi:Prr15l [Columba livia]|nr:Prr15l [Columba livia]
MAESHGWWKLTFLRKRRSVPTVLYESPDSHGAGDTTEGTGEGGPPGYAARLEKIVDKSTKGKHVKVSNSGRFKEKKKWLLSRDETEATERVCDSGTRCVTPPTAT